MWKIMDYKWHTERQKRLELDKENQAFNIEIKALVNANEKLVLAMFRWHSTVLHLVGPYAFKCTSNTSLSRWIRPNNVRRWRHLCRKTDRYREIGRWTHASRHSSFSNWTYPTKSCSLWYHNRMQSMRCLTSCDTYILRNTPVGEKMQGDVESSSDLQSKDGQGHHSESSSDAVENITYPTRSVYCKGQAGILQRKEPGWIRIAWRK